MIFYTADLHFSYEPILHDRPFASLGEMDRTLIENWNAAVSGSDTVYVVGDIGYHNGYVPCRILSQLNGHKHLIRGNHDTGFNDAPLLWRYFESITDFLEIDDGEHHILLSHYPMLYQKQGYMIHGHLHQARGLFFSILQNLPRVRNAGVDINGYRPVTLPELIANNDVFYSEAADQKQAHRTRGGEGWLPAVPDFRPLPQKPQPHKKHLFLTGPKRIGKSTVLRRLLVQRDVTVGGFRTVCVRENGRNSVHLCAAEGDTCTPDNLVFYWENGVTTINHARMATLGCDSLSVSCDLILMDEIGPKEREAHAFQTAVMQALAGNTPVYGVLQQAESPFLDAVRMHPDVELISVTEENRDDLPRLLLEQGW